MSEEKIVSELQVNNDQYLIHVPQGRSARLMPMSKSRRITALYTDNFSTCNILVCINPERLTLMHVDARTLAMPQSIEDEINWIGNNSEVNLIYKKVQGQKLADHLINIIKNTKNDFKFYINPIENGDNTYGITVSFNENKANKIHPQITCTSFGPRPKNLLHHPQEEKSLAVRKIQQIIGKKEFFLTKKILPTKACIFDGWKWIGLPEYELAIDISHPITKREMSSFTANDSFFSICDKQKNIINALRQVTELKLEYTDIEINDAAYYIENYLNSFSNDLLLRRNLIEFITSFQSLNSKDFNTYKDNLLNELRKQGFDYESFSKFAADMIEADPENNFIKAFKDKYEMFSNHYEEREYYKTVIQTTDIYRKQAEELVKAAIKKNINKEYSASLSLLFDAIEHVTYSCLTTDPLLAGTYVLLGNCFFQLDEFQKSLNCLSFAKNLYQRYFEITKPISMKIEDIDKKIEICNAKFQAEENTGLCNP